MKRDKQLVMMIEREGAKRVVKELNTVQKKWSYFWDDVPSSRRTVKNCTAVEVFKIPNETSGEKDE